MCIGFCIAARHLGSRPHSSSASARRPGDSRDRMGLGLISMYKECTVHHLLVAELIDEVGNVVTR